MGKREVLAVMVLVTGLLLFGRTVTTPLGALLVAGGAYLLVLPRLATRQRVQRSRGSGWR